MSVATTVAFLVGLFGRTFFTKSTLRFLLIREGNAEEHMAVSVLVSCSSRCLSTDRHGTSLLRACCSFALIKTLSPFIQLPL